MARKREQSYGTTAASRGSKSRSRTPHSGSWIPPIPRPIVFVQSSGLLDPNPTGGNLASDE
jgi:hypothetical protein